MSIHAQLSEEAQARYNAQKRNATISSIVLSILAIVAIFLLLGIFLLPNLVKESPTLVAYSATTSEDEVQEKKKVSKQIQKKPSPPSNQQTKVLSVSSSAAVSIPVPDVEVSAPSADFGDGEDFGGGWGGDSFGDGGGDFGGVPASMKKRCTEAERSARVKEMGGSVKGEKAVIKALDWLQSTQAENGSWGKGTYEFAMTGFALLAYLGHCETPHSPKYGATVEKAITYLVDSGLATDGFLSTTENRGYSPVYEHAIATYSLAEAYALCNSMNIEIPNLKDLVKKAGQKIMDGQSDNGGWNYNYSRKNSDGDNSIGSWQAQALKACQATGIWADSKIKKYNKRAADFVISTQQPNGAIPYRLRKPDKSHGLTGSGLLTMQMGGKADSKEAKKATQWVLENQPFEWGTTSANLYYHYYNALAMMNVGGSAWTDYNERFHNGLVSGQSSEGYWGGRMEHGPINNHMATCLAAMMLEVYYRFLPGSSLD